MNAIEHYLVLSLAERFRRPPRVRVPMERAGIERPIRYQSIDRVLQHGVVGLLRSTIESEGQHRSSKFIPRDGGAPGLADHRRIMVDSTAPAMLSSKGLAWDRVGSSHCEARGASHGGRLAGLLGDPSSRQVIRQLPEKHGVDKSFPQAIGARLKRFDETAVVRCTTRARTAVFARSAWGASAS